MRAMRLAQIGRVEPKEVKVPKVKNCEVLVKTQAVGVCHSDVHVRSGYVGNISLKDLGIMLPVTLGHEIAGIIEEVGDEVQGFNKGDAVLVYPWIGDGTCYYCKTGEENMCDHPKQLGIHTNGGFAEYVKVPHYKYLFRIRNLSLVEAAPLACAGITTYRAVRKANLRPSEVVTIIGAGGGLGVMAIQIAKATSGATVIGVDIREEALEAAKRAGADHVIDGRSGNATDEIRKLTDGKGTDAVIDFTNSERTLSVYPFALAKHGRYIMVGLHGGELKYPSPLAVFQEIQFLGSWLGSQADFIGIMDMAEKGKVKPMVTKTMRLEEANDAIDNLEHRRAVGRQVLVP
ncbi:MAG: NAD(P)-dependent alcohol dehydrogenase [Chloroflexi bacterium]|nr:NAD(P)-dependent alcohol dehydrogenase [Chloroflexota bacterium]NWF78219.1 NAD(P)-dependent alcohol dehydrogenase [Chloroflexota bacterium]